LNTFSKLALLVLVVGLFSVAPVFADSSDSFTFTSTLGNIGTSDTFTSGGVSLTLTGYSAPGVTSDLSAKNEGPTEFGVGMASGTDHEIAGSLTLQVDLQQILALHPSSITLGISSLQAGETYQIWGSNTAGTPGTLLASNQSGTTFNLTNDQFRFITISSPNASVLLDGLVATVPSSTSTPEPSSAALLLVGLAGLAGVGLLAKK
jgi:hypothetical protein